MSAIANTPPVVTLNNDQRLYVLKYAGGVSCMGFDVVENYVSELLARLGDTSMATTPASGAVGSLERYEYYQALLKVYARIGDTKTWFSPNTPDKLKNLLERLRADRTPVRLFYGNPETGLDSLDCWDTTGTIGRTGGTIRSLILVPKGDIGGGIISTDRILKVVSLMTGRVLYEHEKYHLPELTIAESEAPEKADKAYRFAVSADGQTTARFKTYAKACNWLAFVSGEHNKTPR